MLHIVEPSAKARALSALAHPDRRPFKVAPVMPPDPTDPKHEENRRTHRTAKASILYIHRKRGSDRFGILPTDYLSKSMDLVAHGRQHPTARFPAQYREGFQIWEEADAAAAENPKLPSAMHMVLALPAGRPNEWKTLVIDYLDEFFVSRGMVCEWAIHALRGDDQGWTVSPHVHVIVTTLGFRQGKRPGKRNRAWLATADQIAAAETEWLRRTNLKPSTYTL
jgi:MobA/MobL family